MDSAGPKMSRLINEIVTTEDAPLESTETLKEMEDEWEEDWAQL